MSNSFILCPTHFSRRGEKISREGFAPLRHPGYVPAEDMIGKFRLTRIFIGMDEFSLLEKMILRASGKDSAVSQGRGWTPLL